MEKLWIIKSSGSMPVGPAIIVVHIASVWVPFTSESKASVASYPDINKELRLAIQECARSLQVYVKRKAKSALEEEKEKNSEVMLMKLQLL